jgi:hypothetical protein
VIPAALYDARTNLTTSMPVIVSQMLPIRPGAGEVGRRIVRHGLADVLEWLGEDVGPKPDEATHAFVMDGKVLASQELVDGIRKRGLS